VRKIRSAVSILGYVSHTTGEVSCYRIIEAFDLGWKFHLTDIIFMFTYKFDCRLFQIINWLRTLSSSRKLKSEVISHTLSNLHCLCERKESLTSFIFIRNCVSPSVYSCPWIAALLLCLLLKFISVERPLAIERYSDTLKNVCLNALRVDFKPPKASSHRPNSSSYFAL
jgi:hypothetical protein